MSASLTEAVKRLATEGGFARVGIAPAGPLGGDVASRLTAWLAAGRHAGMAYMARHVPQRLDPSLLVPGAQSIICLAVSYAPPAAAQPPAGRTLVARYARGRDYHRVLRQRCISLMDRIRQVEPAFAGRAFVDSAPLAERSLAARAGLGWIGRNGCLVVPGLGSYVVLAEIVCNLPLEPAEPIPSGCDGCGRCVAACPTGALLAGGTVDCRLCLSYLTIEHAGELPPAQAGLLAGRIFGCDSCQAACPHNAGLAAGDGELATPSRAAAALHGASPADLLGLDEPTWDSLTRGSPIRRCGYGGLMRNIVACAGGAAYK
jgi:epoxyqueuosine reductase